MIRSQFELDFSGDTIYPTIDGGTLHISESSFEGEYEMGIHDKADTDDLPTDILYSKLCIPDEEGAIWECESRFKSGFLISRMNDMAEPTRLISYENAEPEAIEAFNGDSVLKGVQFSSDDRCRRLIGIDEGVVEVQFYYTQITFDLAFSPKDSYLHRLYVKLYTDESFTDKLYADDESFTEGEGNDGFYEF